MPLPKLHDWPAGPTLPQGGQLQEAVDGLRYLAEQDALRGDPPNDWRLQEIFPAILTGAGPAGQPDGHDCLYWARRQYLVSTSTTDPVFFFDDPNGQSRTSIYRAANLAEYRADGGGTHMLPTNDVQPVLVLAFFARGPSSTLARHVFSLEPDLHPDVWPAAPAAQPGVYDGYTWDAPGGTIDLSEGVTPAVLGSQGRACKIVNRREEGGAGHMLDLTGTYKPTRFPGSYKGTSTDDPPLPIYAIDAIQSKACTSGG